MQHAQLTSLFSLEKIEQGIYRAPSWDLGFPALFGGQVLGQSIAAAYQTVATDRRIHSLHSYFLLSGDAKLPVVYNIENVRDGKSFSTRRVKAIQKGRTIYDMTASFQIKESGLSHQYADMQLVPAPEDVVPDIKYYEDKFDELPARLQEALIYHRPVDIRTINGANSIKPIKTDPSRAIWIKSRDKLAEQLPLHQAALAYTSDYHFLSTALQAHGVSVQDSNLRLATIDHAMWFHHDFAFDDWLLYEMHSPFSGNSRGLVQGKVFNQNGLLVATTVQEGLMRQI